MLHRKLDRPVLSQGFTLIEMLIVAPILIIMIGIFINAIVNMTGDVLSIRGSNDLAFSVQDSLNRIEQDVKNSDLFLATDSFTLTSPQGYGPVNNTAFHNANDSGSGKGQILILDSYTTTTNPISSLKNIIYRKDSPNPCGDSENQNSKLKMNIVYFVKDSKLWRRVIAPADYATAGCSGGVATVPWQRPSCEPTNDTNGYPAGFCKAQDTLLINGVQTDGFDIKYLPSTSSTTPYSNANDSTLSDSVRQAVLRLTPAISVTLTASKTIAGRDISQTGTIRTSNDTEPAVAPLTPVADWLATYQGDYYGSFYNLVSKSYATVTRAGAKTIYDPYLRKIFDVPANHLGIRPRSDGKSGNEAVIEEGRTNLLTNSYNLTGWGEISGTNTDAVYGNTSSVVNVPSGGWASVMSSYVSVSPNTTYTLSGYIKHLATGKNEAARIVQYDSSYSVIGTWTQGSTNDGNSQAWQRLSVTLTSASNAAYFKLAMPSSQGPYTYYVDAVQLEQGAFTTSYIPTIATAVARNADVVSIPTTGISASNGSVAVVAGPSVSYSTYPYIWGIPGDGNNFVGLYRDTGGDYHTYLMHGGVSTSPTYGGDSNYRTLLSKWSSSTGNAAMYKDGTGGSTQSGFSAFSNWPATPAYIGEKFDASGGQYNGPIQRLIIYSSALSDDDVTTVTNAIKDGP